MSKRKIFILFAVIVILFEITVALVGDIYNRPAWGDEYRLHETVIDFAENFSIEYIKSYNQLSTPLPFIIYAGWGKIFGMGLFPLRILSIIIAILTYLIFFTILQRLNINPKLTMLSALFLVFHPYMVGLSIFVFTDMSAILFLLFSCLFFLKKQPVWLAICLALSILCRQYMLFFVPALFAYSLTQFRIGEQKPAIRNLLASIGSVIPFGILVIYWGGFSPDNQWREFYISDGFYFHFSNLSLYLCLLFAYLIPYYFVLIKKIFSDWKILISALVISQVYWLIPVSPSPFSVDIDVHTVGLFHKGIKYIFINDSVVQFIFYLCFLMSLPILGYIIRSLIKTYKNKETNIIMLFDLALIFFLMIMPFSYLGWEKYFMPMVPLLILRWSNEIKKISQDGMDS